MKRIATTNLLIFAIIIASGSCQELETKSYGNDDTTSEVLIKLQFVLQLVSKIYDCDLHNFKYLPRHICEFSALGFSHNL